MFRKSVLSASYNLEISNRLPNSFTVNERIKSWFKLKAIAENQAESAVFESTKQKIRFVFVFFCDRFQFKSTLIHAFIVKLFSSMFDISELNDALKTDLFNILRAKNRIFIKISKVKQVEKTLNYLLQKVVLTFF